MKKWIVSIIALILVVLCTVFFFREYIVKNVLSAYLARQLKADVDITRARLDSNYNISIESLHIRNEDGLDLHAGTGVLKLYPLYFLKQGLGIKFNLQDIRFLYSDIKVVNSVFEMLSLGNVDELKFLSAKGEFSYVAGKSVLKSLYLDGELMRVKAHGMIDDSSMDYDIRLFLSGALTSEIPEAIKKVFFKQEGGWSNAELKISGSRDNPSINFSTDLFTLSVS
jgi:hypothetical protein